MAKKSVSSQAQHPHTLSAEQAARTFDVTPAQGLSTAEAHRRQQRYGANALQQTKKVSLWVILLRQFKGAIVWILVAAGAVSFLIGDTVEGWAILAVLLLNAGLGFVLEWRARESMAALRDMDVAPARVWRDGKAQEISSEAIVPGDILLVEAGDLVAADANVVETNQLQTDESALTGESLPVAKKTDPTPAKAALGDQFNRLFKGSSVTAGNGRAIVTNIGQKTELGRIANLVAGAKRSATPLEAKLDALARVLIWVTAALAVVFLVVGWLRGEPPALLIKTAVALAIAAIPEGMSVVATVALAYGMLRLARKKVIIKQLSSVETLGGTTVIFTDKTGTLTENRIEVHTIQLADVAARLVLEVDGKKLKVTEGEAAVLKQEEFLTLARVAALTNNASIDGKKKKALGDPLEIALLEFAGAAGVELGKLAQEFPREAEEPFSSDTRFMATLHKHQKGHFVAVKGALEAVLTLCSGLDKHERDEQQQLSEAMAVEGLRTLAFAYRESTAKPGEKFVGKNLTYLGLIGFLDPPRTEVRASLQTCRDAGIKVIMVTGDHPATALTIAKQVGLVEPEETLVLTGQDLPADKKPAKAVQDKLLDCHVFARVSPEQKLDLIALYQRRGDIVAMTGDGVNDAPALKKADIGIAMGQRGTQVAADTATMVLKNDSFKSIVAAVAQGRVIFENIRKFILFLLSCNLSEVLVVTFASFLQVGNALLPLQILFINIVTDVFPALALGVGKENGTLMQQPPRDPKLPLLSQADWLRIGGYASAMTVTVLGVYWYATRELDLSATEGNTLVFYALSLAQLLHVFNLYSAQPGAPLRSFFSNEITRNRYVWLALVGCVGILALTYFVPLLARVLSIEALSGEVWGLVLLAGFAPVVLVQVATALLGRRKE